VRGPPAERTAETTGTGDQQVTFIALTTDFGTVDHYVAAMKGVILTIAPQVRLIDVTHEVTPHDIVMGAFTLRSVWPWFPRGTIHVAVVDPGVGSERRILLGRYDGRYVIAPDNGLITLVHRATRLEEMRVVENRHYFFGNPSATFHGRDIMAAVAAHLANGVKTRDFGRKTDRVEMLPIAHRCDTIARRITGRGLYVDRFGTIITNIHRNDLTGAVTTDRELEVTVNAQPLGPVRDYFDQVAPGEALALVGSTGYLEIAVNRGRAVERFGPPEDLKVEVR
jgi:hypothetical protein